MTPTTNAFSQASDSLTKLNGTKLCYQIRGSGPALLRSWARLREHA